MAIDMSQFYQVFFEETEEHLASMETLLLALDIDHPDAEELNAIFRAAHSIKGSSATFGFTDLTQVTHILENLLDRIRRGDLPVQRTMIDAFLDAGDVLKKMLLVHRGLAPADPRAAEESARICAELKQLAGTTAVEKAALAAPVAPPLPSIAVPHLWLSFVLDTPDDTIFNDLLLAELGSLGTVHVLLAGSPADPRWQLAIEGEAVDGEAVRSALEFVARSDSIRIEQRRPDAASAPAGEGDDYGLFEPLPANEAATAAADDDSFGFFEPLPAIEAEDDDEAYGFFEPLPEAAASADAEDGSYGFFVAPESLLTAAPAVAVAARAEPATPSAQRRQSAAEASIRVGVDKVDQLINLVGELVITQSMLTQAAVGLDPAQFERMHIGLEQLERNMRDLQGAVLSIRMLPISTVFSRFPRVVRDLSQQLGKQVQLKLVGEGTELDKGLIERISDPLTHLVRNSLDHGIELPERRLAAGKPASGCITLKAYHQGGNIVIEVSDDGAGLNRERILAKAIDSGLPASEAMSDQEVWQLIFEPGFSTAAEITELSGRGVGMDVVRRNIAELGGRVEVQSTAGLGSCMTVRLPLTLAILDGMSVGVGDETYLLPLGGVVESLQAEPAMIKSFAGVERLIQLRDEYLPVLALHQFFAVPAAQPRLDQGIMVVVESELGKAALFVDELLGQSQVVIKSLEANFRKVAGVSGATIMGDGRVALILDVPALVAEARSALPAVV